MTTSPCPTIFWVGRDSAYGNVHAFTNPAHVRAWLLADEKRIAWRVRVTEEAKVVVALVDEKLADAR